MKSFMKTLVAAFVLGTVALIASDVPKTLTPEFYKTCTRAKSKLGSILVDPAFVRGQGLSWDGHIEWKANERSTGFARALESSLKDVVRPEGSNKLAVAVIQAETTFFMTGKFVAEFTIRDASGKTVAQASFFTFAMHEKDGSIAFQHLADTIVGDLENDLLK